MKIFDKAKWHIEDNSDTKEVVNKFKEIFEFLEDNKLLSDEGKEIMEIGVDSSVSLNEKMVNTKGAKFLDACYDKVINNDYKNIKEALTNEYDNYKKINTI